MAAFLFRRDLRLFDNTALLLLCRKAAEARLPVLPLFFFNPAQCEPAQNPYFGPASFQFLCESLVDLDGPGQLHGRLVCLSGTDENCLNYIHRKGIDVAMLGYNEDFTPFAAVRDERLVEWCRRAGVTVVTSDADYTLLPPTTVTNGSDQPYSVYTAFYNRFLAEHAQAVPKVDSQQPDVAATFFTKGSALLQGSRRVDPATFYTPVPQLLLHGGRAEGLHLLASVPAMKNYNQDRDDIPADRTSHLAPHLKFGTVSIREVWTLSVKSLGVSHGFPRQLLWREFYAMLIANHPQLVGGQLRAFPDYESTASANPAKTKGKKAVVAVNQPFMAKYLSYKWRWDAAEFDAFTRGRTGVPLVDAAVRCVTATGWCHNRNRMLLANFLVKVLGVDWREGERWFATVAVDYDVANNNGGWLWSSGQGADAQPYFRFFNPFRQSSRFDPNGEFIYRWVPELKNVPPAVLHTWDSYCAKQKHVPCPPTPARLTEGAEVVEPTQGTGSTAKAKPTTTYRTCYPAPIVNIKERTQKIIAEYKKYDPPKK